MEMCLIFIVCVDRHYYPSIQSNKGSEELITPGQNNVLPKTLFYISILLLLTKMSKRIQFPKSVRTMK